ncbi:UDP-N-acetylglucosamine 2-epimerase (non-hydrolyzing) [Rhizobium sp. AQ_MP]|uniref:non-hydrolyzing UDP-N-acetylglucosamine 2-epimerase n=1 Tax=Rhizobium sp. AQ_MP TaxID=2761536 RepID=UPI00163B03E3|nr:UDP-N-acetylglucosamine 2-epimerase (non-hydrolyzing) [Rhizobium sp. AQ_MP]MBC2775766.1 UDP-N-acetylglucosamine 2-epimerase (non-hydrolyzing) [Rhizobium sp. AQ_MP]
MTRKVLTIVGARPQFIKAAAVSRAISRVGDRLTEVMVHTGQHFDENMSAVFFNELEIPAPAHNLEISSGTHGSMTGRMLVAVEEVMLAEKPDWVLIYGDTNSTLAGALAAAKLHIPVAHVEAGLRSFNMRMPEEVNRVLSDRVSALLLCPTDEAVTNLRREGITTGVFNVGDVMYDVALHMREKARAQSDVLRRLGLEQGKFVLATCHRQENTDDPARLGAIVEAFRQISVGTKLVLPLHPRTRKLLNDATREKLSNVILTDPLGFLDMVALEQAAQVIVTDSGGVQKEAFFYGVPCVTMRDETEWVETVALGWNSIVGADTARVVSAVTSAAAQRPVTSTATPYGDGRAAEHVVDHLLRG